MVQGIFIACIFELLHRNVSVNVNFVMVIDFDNDEYIGTTDLEQALVLVTKQELTPEERQQIAEKVIEESDVDGDGKLSFMEFEHVITRSPDFVSTFHIRI